MKYKIFVLSVLSLLLSLAPFAAEAEFEPPFPISADECKDNGWRFDELTYKNQGDCVSFFATEGRNEPDGPPIHD